MKRGTSLLTKLWRLSVFGALLLVIVEGAIRKWLLPGLSEVVYFAKDGVLLLAYGLFLLAPRERFEARSFPGLGILLAVTAAWIVFEAFNVMLGSSIVGAFGVKCYLWYVPLLFLVPHLFESTNQIERFLRRYLLLLIPVCVLGVAQFFSPPDSPINRYAFMSDETNVVGFGDEEARTRVTGTFAYITGHATYLQVTAALLLTLFCLPLSTFWYIIGICQYVLIIGNVLMSGSRGPAFLIAGMTIAFMASAVGRHSVAMRRLRVALIIMVIAGSLGVAFAFRDAFNVFMYRVESSGDTAERLKVVDVGSLDDALDAAGAGGFGAGATQPGANALRRILGIPPMMKDPPEAEAEYLRVMLEIGPIGFLAWYALRFYLLAALLVTWRDLRHPFLRQLGFAAMLIHLISLPQSLVINQTFGVYYWLFSGFIFLLPRLEAKEMDRLRLRAALTKLSATPATAD
jgi:hypothetical protein